MAPPGLRLAKCCASPIFDLGLDQQGERLALAQRMVRAMLQDPEVSFRGNATGVVSLVGGSMDRGGDGSGCTRQRICR